MRSIRYPLVTVAFQTAVGFHIPVLISPPYLIRSKMKPYTKLPPVSLYMLTLLPFQATPKKTCTDSDFIPPCLSCIVCDSCCSSVIIFVFPMFHFFFKQDTLRAILLSFSLGVGIRNSFFVFTSLVCRTFFCYVVRLPTCQSVFFCMFVP